MRAYKWISTLLALCLLLALIPGSLAEAADGAEYFPELDEFDLGAPEDARVAAPPEADVPKAGGSEVPLKDYNFPDASFRSYLEKNVDTDGSGTLSDAEINNVVMLDLSGLLIYDLKGIEFFPVLSRLYCSNNQLSSLDLRGNHRLSVLDCSANRLTSLRFEQPIFLNQLMCQQNDLTTLDLGVLSPDAQPLVLDGVALTDTPMRVGGSSSSSLGEATFCVVCDDYIELTLNGKVLRTLVPRRLAFEPAAIDLFAGQTRQLAPIIEPAGLDFPLYYATNDDSGTLSVTEGGLVTALKPGTVRIFAYTDKACAPDSEVRAVDVTVKPPEPTGIQFKYSKTELGVGETRRMAITVTPSDAVTELTVGSEKPKVAAAALIGSGPFEVELTGLKVGSAKITATTANGKKAACRLTVKPAPEKVVLDKKGTVKLGLDNSMFVTVSVEPKDSASSLTWTSSDESVASVVTGTVTARKKGTAKITVETFNGLKASFKVKVIDPVPTEITLDRSNVKLNVGDTKQLTATIKPENAQNKKVTWSSSNKKVARVDKNGLVVARKKGAATITAKTANGIKAKCTVQVVIPEPTQVQILHTKTSVKVKKKLTLKVNLLPAHAESKLTWSSSDTTIATVNKKGEVKGKKKGKATITVRTANGLEDSIKITVK